jgi:hypothetical protein
MNLHVVRKQKKFDQTSDYKLLNCNIKRLLQFSDLLKYNYWKEFENVVLYEDL